MAFDTPPYTFTGAHRYPPLPLGSRVPMQMPPFISEYEQDPPWKKKKPSLFWESQLDRVPETSWFSRMPYWVQGPMDAWKSLDLGGEVASEKSRENLSKFISGLGETKKEREDRLDKERKEAAAKRFKESQTERRMPTYTPSIEKIDEEEDLMEKYLKYMLVSNLIGAGAAEDYAGTSTVSIGQARDWPTMPSMFG